MYTTTIIIAILACVIGFFIGKYYRTSSDTNWKEEFENSSKELKSVSKKNKKSQKTIHQLENQKSGLQEKIDSLEAKYLPITEDLNAQINTAKTDLEAKQKEIDKLTSDNEYTSRQLEKLKKEHKRFQEKYASDLSDSKGWAHKQDRLNNEITELRNRITKQKTEAKELKAKLEAQKERMQEVSKFAQEFRNMKATNRKLTKDLDYWEKKHYDTHHELASTLKNIETLKAEHEELILRMKGGQIQQQNMMKKIEEYKTKFVNVNNLYHELKAQVN